jgi:ribonuclease R
MNKPELVGELQRNNGQLWVRDLFVAGAEATELAGGQPKDILEAGAGSIVRAVHEEDGWRAREVLAERNSALAKMYAIAGDHALAPVFPEAVQKEVEALLADPGIDDPSLDDLVDLPFVTIDGPGTRDLDQAMYIEARDGGGWKVLYALADPAWCVTPGTALFDESLRRGSSYYLPGLCVPMLPRALSEGITSLNEKQLRRAVVFEMAVDADGECVHTSVRRARVRSRSQLTFRQVQRFLDGEESLPDRSAEPSVRLLRDVGRARMRRAVQRNVIHYRRTEVEVKLHGGLRFVIDLAPRSSVEKYNEQLSLMCNVEGARMIRDHGGEHVQPIYRIHAPPDARRYEKLEALIAAIVKRHHLDEDQWAWRRGGDQSLADYLAALPTEGAEGRLATAIHRQAVLTNVRSVFSDEPSGHHGVGAEIYARFSAPMRELVGVFLHKELFEKLDHGDDAGADETLREQIIDRANESRALQKQLTNEANRVVLDELFTDDRQLPREDRPRRIGTVMGLTPTKAHVLLDDPRIEVKVYTKHQQEVDGAPVRISDDGAAMLRDGNELCRIGDEVVVRVHGRDKRDDRWMLVIE